MMFSFKNESNCGIYKTPSLEAASTKLNAVKREDYLNTNLLSSFSYS